MDTGKEFKNETIQLYGNNIVYKFHYVTLFYRRMPVEACIIYVKWVKNTFDEKELFYATK